MPSGTTVKRAGLTTPGGFYPSIERGLCTSTPVHKFRPPPPKRRLSLFPHVPLRADAKFLQSAHLNLHNSRPVFPAGGEGHA